MQLQASCWVYIWAALKAAPGLTKRLLSHNDNDAVMMISIAG